jgi:hypothetical protein
MPLNHDVHKCRERERERERETGERESNFLLLDTGVSLRWTQKNNKQIRYKMYILKNKQETKIRQQKFCGFSMLNIETVTSISRRFAN